LAYSHDSYGLGHPRRVLVELAERGSHSDLVVGGSRYCQLREPKVGSHKTGETL
jgi:hypothetical protein